MAMLCSFLFSTHDNLEMWALAWLSMVLFREIQFGAIQFSAYM
jgi:hypothetical protein